MTLCIATKDGDYASLASDSRITFDQSYFDYCIKVFSIPIKINPVQYYSSTEEKVLEYDIGMCIAGNFINAYVVKESINEILQRLQYIPGRTDISLARIAELIRRIYHKITIELGSALRLSL